MGGGKVKLEASCDKALHSVKDLKLEVKSDCVDPAKVDLGCNYGGISDTLVVMNAPAMKPAAFNLEITRSLGPITAGCKAGLANIAKPDVGCRYISGPVFASLFATKGFSVFKAHTFYKVSDDIKLACFYEHAAKPSGGAGAMYKVDGSTSVKAKVMMNRDVCATLKYGLSKGFTVLFGAKYNVGEGFKSWGLQVSLE